MKTNKLYVLMALICCAVTATSACHRFAPESLVAAPWHKILSFKFDGETRMGVTSSTTQIEGVNELVILCTGSDMSSVADATLCIMSDEEAQALSADFVVVDRSCCTFDGHLHFNAGQTGMTVAVSLDGARILDQIRSDASRRVVLPFKLESADSVNAFKNHMVYILEDGEKK